MTTLTMQPQLADLAQERAAKIIKRPRFRAFVDWLTVKVLQFHFEMGASFIDTHAKRMGSNAVWFRGATAGVDELREQGCDDPFDPTFALCDRLAGLEASLLGSRQRLMALCGDLSHPKLETHQSVARLHQAASHLVAAQADAYEALKDFRYAIQSYEADRAARAHARSGCAASLDELQAQLNCIAS